MYNYYTGIANGINYMNKRVRLVDIAEKVGVSKGAVAAVLNGKNTLRIGRETSEKILAAAKALNYEPNLTARMLAGKESMVIGALIDSYAPPLVYRILRELEKSAVQAGYRVMIGHAHDNMEHFFECYQNFVKHGIDGVVCFGHEYPGQQDKVKKFFADKKNIIFLNAPCFEPASYLDLGIETGIYAAMEHLVGLGRRRIGIMTSTNRNSSTMKREKGFRAGIAAYGADENSCSIKAVENPLDHEVLRRQTADYLDTEVIPRHLDAVIARNDVFALELIRQAILRGMKVPGDLAVVGLDNDVFSESCYPSLTTIDQKPAEVGQVAFEMLLECMKGSSGGTIVRKIETELIIRESTGNK